MECCFCTIPIPIPDGRGRHRRGPANAICFDCYQGAQTIILSTNKTDDDTNSFHASRSHKGFVNALKWMEETKELLNEKMAYLSGFADAWRDRIHTDIRLKPGDNEPSIPAHRALLATRSVIFRNMLDSDKCKAPADQTITLPELDHEELEALLEFLYSGSLPKEKVKKHVCSLAIAADKYEIPFLQKFCENELLLSMNSSNALDILEIADTCSNQNLKEKAQSFIVSNMKDIVFTPDFDAFALKNPHLVAEITRASFVDSRKRKNEVR
ncbi:BTB/POZ domain-containing protein-like protein [Salvia divinorum]|uniref:BTB/POZ domain-containing protein-like protein n=1 Tax=Salvia divinorum TaxID=28513 RepID=A0ABD1GD82_SALDI